MFKMKNIFSLVVLASFILFSSQSISAQSLKQNQDRPEVEANNELQILTNELDLNDAKILLKNGCLCVSEGANMPSTKDAVHEFQKAKILFAPGKASNAGGVATSGLEMTQNSLRYNWSREEVDKKLKDIMLDIHDSCIEYGSDDNGYVDYVKGANIAGFVKVADAMLAQGIV